MGVKYVKDFVFPKSGGFHGSNVQRYAKGGAVRKANGGMMPEAPVAKPIPVSLPPEMPVGAPIPEEPVKFVDPYEKAKRDIITGDFIPPRRRPAPRSPLVDMARRAANEMRQGTAPRRNSREMAMVGREDERMMGRTAPKRMKAPRVPMSPSRDIDYDSMPVGVMGGGEEYWGPGGGKDQQAEATRRWRESQGLPPLAEAPIRQTGYQMETPYMPEFNLDPEEIREYSRSRTFSPEVMYAKGGKVTSKKGQAKVGKVMREFKEGKLHSGSKKGPKVTNPKQAMAIALSEARRMKKAEGGEVKKARKEEGKKKPKMKMEDLALKKMRHAEKYAPGLDLDNIHSYELSQEAKKEKKVEKYAKGGKVHSDVKMDKAMVRKAVHKHESEKHPGESRTKLRRGGVPVHSGKPMYGGGK